MVYKIGTTSALHSLPFVDDKVKEKIVEKLKILDDNYGSSRDVDNDYGGYVLYAEHGTNASELLSYFNYKEHYPEHVECIYSDPKYCCSLYLTSTEYGVVILTALSDTPKEVTDELSD